MPAKFAPISSTASLPRITRFFGVSDGGPCDAGEPSAYCPHCGSGGRYIHHFECEDGSRRGAMSGCVQLFPVAPIAREDMTLSERERDLQKRFGKTAKLNSWDQKIRETIDRFYAGGLNEPQAMEIIRHEYSAKAAYRRNRRRRW